MAEKEPTLVGKDGTRQTPSEAPVTRSDFLTAIREQNAVLAEAIGTVRAEGEARTAQLAQSLAEIKADREKGEYNVANYPGISVFNLFGDKARPKPTLKGEVYWGACLFDERDMTAQEITLANQLTVGVYHHGDWEVINLNPGRGARKLRVKFPQGDPDQRAALPSDYLHPTEKEPVYNPETQQIELRRRRVTGIEVMLQEMVDEAAGRVSVSA